VNDAFDRLAAAADTPMVVVTAAYGDERGGCLVGFHTQCSIDPPRAAVWLSKANHTLRVALQATHLGVHYLEGDDRDLARLFGERSGDDVDKFELCSVENGLHGVPLLTDCRNRVIGRRVSFSDDGCDHVCFVVEIEAVDAGHDIDVLRLSSVADLHPGHEAEEQAAET
jgi:flavin reductase (DIM6/NTAB) family NADH-FMN oxidoreductase RutF